MIFTKNFNKKLVHYNSYTQPVDFSFYLEILRRLYKGTYPSPYNLNIELEFHLKRIQAEPDLYNLYRLDDGRFFFNQRDVRYGYFSSWAIGVFSEDFNYIDYFNSSPSNHLTTIEELEPFLLFTLNKDDHLYNFTDLYIGLSISDCKSYKYLCSPELYVESESNTYNYDPSQGRRVAKVKKADNIFGTFGNNVAIRGVLAKLPLTIFKLDEIEQRTWIFCDTYNSFIHKVQNVPFTIDTKVRISKAEVKHSEHKVWELLESSVLTVENTSFLLDLHFLLLHYLYEQSTISLNYVGYAVTINHCPEQSYVDSIVELNKLKPYWEKNFNPNTSDYHQQRYSSLKVVVSKRVKKLSNDILRLLERYNLLTNSLKVSHYYIDMTKLTTIDVMNYLTENNEKLSLLN